MQDPALTELILLSKQCDAKAFRKLVAMHQARVFSLAFRLLCNEEDAKDIVQETYIRVWKHLDQYKTEMKFTTWLYAIATHLCYDRLKTLKRKGNFQPIDSENLNFKFFLADGNIETAVINSELAKIITLLTDELTPKQKLVFTLRDLECLEVTEIKTVTGLSAKKIKSNLYLARQYIRKKLEKM
jgi:RNA polymerase sigma-70 factor (ECF subfamily)